MDSWREVKGRACRICGWGRCTLGEKGRNNSGSCCLQRYGEPVKGKDARHTPKPADLGNKAIRREGAREEKQVSSEHTTQGRGGEGTSESTWESGFGGMRT